MRSKLYVALALSVAAVGACPVAARTVTTRPTSIGEVYTSDGVGWAVDYSGTYAVAQRSVGQPAERRGVLEFNLSGVPAGAVITGATIGYTVGVFGGPVGGDRPVLEFRGSAGNGMVDAADATRPYAVLGASPPIDALARYTTAIDPAYVRSLVNGAAAWTTPWLAAVTYQQTAGTQAGVYKFQSESASPLLTVEYAPPDVWVTGSDFGARRHASTTGAVVETVAVPYPAGQTRSAQDTYVRGTVVDRSGRLSVYNGAAAPYVSTYDPAAGTWDHRTDAGLTVPANAGGPFGTVAAFGSYLMASDMIAGTSAPQPNGVVRFNTADGSVTRFGGGPFWTENADFLTRGHDGLLYVLSEVFSTGQRRVVKAFNPYSGALVRSVTLPVPVNAIAVGETGEIYATTAQGTVYDFSPAGTVVNSLSVASELKGIDLWTDGSIVVGSQSNGVHLTDTSLTSQTTIVPYAGVSTAFVSFAVPAPERGWRNDAVTVGTAPSWGDPRNWNGWVPDAADGGANSIAVFGPAITGDRAVTLESARTVGTLVFDSAYSYRILNGGSTTRVLTMDVPAGQRALIDVVRGSHTLLTRVVLNDDLTIHTGAGATVAFPPNFGAVPGRLDIGGHNVIWDYAAGDVSPAETIRADLKAGRGTSGAWNGPGIVSSVAAADASKLTGVGWAEVSDLGITSFAGQAVDGSAVVLEVAFYGDANLDGVVNADDFALVDRGMAKGLTGWVNGDFNYDGVITSADYLLMDQVYAHQGGGLSPGFVAEREARFGAGYVAELQAAVPEPGAGLLLVAAAGWVARRRRR